MLLPLLLLLLPLLLLLLLVLLLSPGLLPPLPPPPLPGIPILRPPCLFPAPPCFNGRLLVLPMPPGRDCFDVPFEMATLQRRRGPEAAGVDAASARQFRHPGFGVA